jgi:hypothetical protein
MLFLLVFTAIVFFIAHVVLLLISFSKGELIANRYFYSHLTLWLTGITVFILAELFNGKGVSPFLDYFSRPMRKASILLFTFALSLVAHCIVKFVVLPLLQKSKA